MNKNVRPGVRTGSPTANVISPAAAANIGVAKGDHITGKGTVKRPAEPLVTGKIRQPVALGNAVALNVGKGGPGQGRVVHRSGSQSATPAPAAVPAGRDILGEFGPESVRRK